MNEDVLAASHIETEFLAGAQANLEQACGGLLCGTSWRVRHDQQPRERRLRDAGNPVVRNERLMALPSNRRIEFHGHKRTWWMSKQPTVVAVATVWSPLAHFESTEADVAPPMDVADLVDHVQAIIEDSDIPHIIGICSTTGFTEEARRSQLSLPETDIVLVERGSEGSWRCTPLAEGLAEDVVALFDPLHTSRKIDHLRDEIASLQDTQSISGLGIQDLAARHDLPQAVVDEVCDKAASADPTLRIVADGGNFVLVKADPIGAEESQGTGIMARIFALFDREGQQAEKIKLMTDQRDRLARQRDRVFDRMAKLESEEASLLRAGAAATLQTRRKQLAAQIVQIRSAMVHQNTLATMLGKQINILDTDIHNLDLIRQGEQVKLPDSDTLTRNAVAAEEMLESLSADAELAQSLDAATGDAIADDQTEAILQEFETTSEAERTQEPQARARREEAAEPQELPEDTEQPDRQAEPE